MRQPDAMCTSATCYVHKISFKILELIVITHSDLYFDYASIGLHRLLLQSCKEKWQTTDFMYGACIGLMKI